MAEKNPEAAEKDAQDGLALRIAVGALVFSELKNRRMNDIRFEWEQALSFEGDSGPYVQNAHVRLCSILRKVGRADKSFNDKDLEGIRWEIFQDEASFAVLDLMAQFGDKVASAAVSRDPCVIAQFVLSLADATHRFLHNSRVIGSPEENERLFLVRGAQSVLAQALEMIGVPAIESM